MDAPVYPPMSAYEEPRLGQNAFGVDDMSLAELLENPAARAVLNKFPAALAIGSSETLKRHLSNFTLRELALFVPALTPEMLVQIDAQLKALPLDQRRGAW